jgi:hypothetical protein
MTMPANQADYAVREHLTNFGTAFGNANIPKEIDRLAPVIYTEDTLFQYGEWTKKSGYQSPGMSIRKSGTLAKEHIFDYTKQTDEIVGYSGRTKVPRQDQRSFDKANPSKTLIEVKTEQMMRLAYDDRRLAFATLLATATNTAAASVKWDSSSTTAIFKTDINTGFNSILDGGRVPNTIFMWRKVARALRNSTEFLNRYTSWTDTVKTADLPPIIEDMEVVILDGLIDANNRALAASLGGIYTDDCYLAYIEKSPDPYCLTAFSTFRPTYNRDVVVDAYYQKDIDSDWVEYNFQEKIKLINQEMFYRISDCLTA